MNQGTTFLLIMTGLMLAFYLFGILPEASTPNSVIMNFLLHPENAQTSTVVLIILGYIAAGYATSLVLGFFVKNTEWSIMGPIGVYLLSLMYDFIVVYQKIAESNIVIAMLIFSPLLILWLFTCIDFIRGRD